MGLSARHITKNPLATAAIRVPNITVTVSTVTELERVVSGSCEDGLGYLELSVVLHCMGGPATETPLEFY